MLRCHLLGSDTRVGVRVSSWMVEYIIFVLSGLKWLLDMAACIRADYSRHVQPFCHLSWNKSYKFAEHALRLCFSVI